MKISKMLPVLMALFADLASGRPLASTAESHSAPQIAAPAGLLPFILNSEDPDETKSITQCAIELGLKNQSYEKLFIVSRAHLTNKPNETYFVRPALAPLCFTFYGAHLFRYWFVRANPAGQDPKAKGPKEKGPKFSMLLQGRSDAISVLPKRRHGFSHLLSGTFTASEWYESKLVFDGKQYVDSSCTVTLFETKKSKPC